MSLVKIEGYQNLRKDPSTGGIINVDKRSYESYMLAKNSATRHVEERKATQESISGLQDEINSIKNDLSEIKGILISLINK